MTATPDPPWADTKGKCVGDELSAVDVEDSGAQCSDICTEGDHLEISGAYRTI